MASIRSGIGEKMEDRYLFKAKRIDNCYWEIGSLITLPTGEYEISNKCNNPLIMKLSATFLTIQSY